MDRPKDPTGAERQKRWRDRRRAAGLPLRRAPERAAVGGHPQAGGLRDVLVDFFAAHEAAHGRGSYSDGETPERVADTALGELEAALHSFVTDYGFDHPSANPATEAARLRLMAHLSAITARDSEMSGSVA